MTSASPASIDIAVAGHICLDIIPQLPASASGLEGLLVPGRLTRIGPAAISTGGAVPNVGLALHRLGLRTMLSGKLGQDELGQVVLGILSAQGAGLVDGMTTARGEPTSYTVVISAPGVDRIFLHCPGANDTYCAADVPFGRVASARCVHFGYPPLMRRMYADGGAELASIMQQFKRLGLTTSLDMAAVDPASDAGKVDWRSLLARVLPHVDVFLPSLDEAAWMLHLPAEAGDDAAGAGRIASVLLELGAPIVVLKLGDQGLLVQTTGDQGRLAKCGRAAPNDTKAWASRQLLAPCFNVTVGGTTGSGDCTIAGFLAGLCKGLGPQQATVAAVGVGACSVEQPDATSGVLPWDGLMARIGQGWARRPLRAPLPSWKWSNGIGLFVGPTDSLL